MHILTQYIEVFYAICNLILDGIHRISQQYWSVCGYCMLSGVDGSVSNKSVRSAYSNLNSIRLYIQMKSNQRFNDCINSFESSIVCCRSYSCGISSVCNFDNRTSLNKFFSVIFISDSHYPTYVI